MKLDDKVKAIKLRRAGNSYKTILEQIAVSKSTLSIWLRDVPLTLKQQKARIKGRALSRLLGAKSQQKRRIERTKVIIKNSQKEFRVLVTNPLFLSGLMLYWAEGDKHQGERVKFTNSDEKMIRLMMRWFRKVCHVPEEKFRIALHLHNLHTIPNAQGYWRGITKIPAQQFHKVYVKHSSLGHRRNILYNGTCGIVINNKDLFRRIFGWKIASTKYFKLD